MLDMTPLGWLGRKTSTQTNKHSQGKQFCQNCCATLLKRDLKRKNLLPFRVNPFSEGAWFAGLQTGRHKNCVPCETWQRICHVYLLPFMWDARLQISEPSPHCQLNWQQTDNIFLSSFFRNRLWHFIQITSLWKVIFLGKNKKNIQNVVCWYFNPAC